MKLVALLYSLMNVLTVVEAATTPSTEVSQVHCSTLAQDPVYVAERNEKYPAAIGSYPLSIALQAGTKLVLQRAYSSEEKIGFDRVTINRSPIMLTGTGVV